MLSKSFIDIVFLDLSTVVDSKSEQLMIQCLHLS